MPSLKRSRSSSEDPEGSEEISFEKPPSSWQNWIYRMASHFPFFNRHQEPKREKMGSLSSTRKNNKKAKRFFVSPIEEKKIMRADRWMALDDSPFASKENLPNNKAIKLSSSNPFAKNDCVIINEVKNCEIVDQCKVNEAKKLGFYKQKLMGHGKPFPNTVLLKPFQLQDKERYRQLIDQNVHISSSNQAPVYLAPNHNKEPPVKKMAGQFGKVVLGNKQQALMKRNLESLKKQNLASAPWDDKRKASLLGKQVTLESARKPSVEIITLARRPSVEYVSTLDVMNRSCISQRSFSKFPSPRTLAMARRSPIKISDEDDDEIVCVPVSTNMQKRRMKSSSGSPSIFPKTPLQEAKSFPLYPMSPSNSEGFFAPDFLDHIKSEIDQNVYIHKEKLKQTENLVKSLSDKREAKALLDNQKRLQYIRLQDPLRFLESPEASDDEDLDIEVQFPQLSPEMESKIEEAMRPNPPNEIVSKGFGISISRKDIETLSGLNWLNDEVVNYYTSLLVERGKLDNFPSIYAFNTFFYPKLINGGHNALKRWTRKVDIFSYDMIIIPVHLGMHWCLAVVDFRCKAIRYYDSMGGQNTDCLNALKDYLVNEMRDKKKSELDMSAWKLETVKDIPQQMNGSDCGMFAMKYAEYITRNAKITFSQSHMPYFRKRMVLEIITNQLL